MITYGAGLTAVKPKIRWLINSSIKMIADTILKFTVPLPALVFMPIAADSVIAKLSPLPMESRKQKSSPAFAA